MKNITMAFILCLISGFVSAGKPEILNVLPAEIEGFKYISYHVFPKGLGVSIRYQMTGRGEEYVDIYIWPVGLEKEKTKHPDLVKAATQNALNDIRKRFKDNKYDNLKIVRDMSKFNEYFSVANLNLALLKGEEFDFSWLLVTEVEGTFIKIRSTYEYAIDNDPTKPIMLFGATMLGNIVSYLEGPNKLLQPTAEASAE